MLLSSNRWPIFKAREFHPQVLAEDLSSNNYSRSLFPCSEFRTTRERDAVVRQREMSVSAVVCQSWLEIWWAHNLSHWVELPLSCTGRTGQPWALSAGAGPALVRLGEVTRHEWERACAQDKGSARACGVCCAPHTRFLSPLDESLLSWRGK